VRRTGVPPKSGSRQPVVPRILASAELAGRVVRSMWRVTMLERGGETWMCAQIGRFATPRQYQTTRARSSSPIASHMLHHGHPLIRRMHACAERESPTGHLDSHSRPPTTTSDQTLCVLDEAGHNGIPTLEHIAATAEAGRPSRRRHAQLLAHDGVRGRLEERDIHYQKCRASRSEAMRPSRLHLCKRAATTSWRGLHWQRSATGHLTLTRTYGLDQRGS
jgi:hypothetical protein